MKNIKRYISVALTVFIVLSMFSVNSIKSNAAYTEDPYLTIDYSSNNAHLIYRVDSGARIIIPYDYKFKCEKEQMEFIITKKYSDIVFSHTTHTVENKGDYYDYSSYTWKYTVDTTGFLPGVYYVQPIIYYYDNGWKKSLKSSEQVTIYINGVDNDDPSIPIYISYYYGENYSNTKKKVYSTIYKNEWVKGKWFNNKGELQKNSSITWHHDSGGWWYTNELNNYWMNVWEKIDDYYYYFKSDGYMAQNEWIDGYWLGDSGAWTYRAKLSWHRDSHGWWIQDSYGWYPQSQWQKIDGVWRYFDSSGYMVTNQYVDGYWLGWDGRYY